MIVESFAFSLNSLAVLVTVEHQGTCGASQEMCVVVYFSLDPELQSALLSLPPCVCCPQAIPVFGFMFLHRYTVKSWKAVCVGSWQHVRNPCAFRASDPSVAPGDCCPHVAEVLIGSTPHFQDVIPSVPF